MPSFSARSRGNNSIRFVRVVSSGHRWSYQDYREIRGEEGNTQPGHIRRRFPLRDGVKKFGASIPLGIGSPQAVYKFCEPRGIGFERERLVESDSRASRATRARSFVRSRAMFPATYRVIFKRNRFIVL